MPLQTQAIDVLFSGGVDKKTAKHVVAQPKLTRLENWVFRGGLLSRRSGCERLFGPGDDTAANRLGTDAMLGVCKGRLVARDKTRLLVWSEEAGALVPGVTAPPPSMLLDKRRVYGFSQRTDGHDSAVAGGFEVHSWSADAANTGTFIPNAQVVDSNGAIIVQPQVIGSNSSPTGSQSLASGSPRAIPMTGCVGLFWGDGAALKARFFRAATPTLIEDAVTVDANALLHFDGDALGDGRAVVGIIRAANNSSTRTVQLDVVTAAGAVAATTTVATYSNANKPFGTLFGVSDLDSIAVGVSREGNIFVVYAVKNGSAHNSLRAAVYSPSLGVVTADTEILDVSTLDAAAYRTSVMIGKGLGDADVYLAVEYYVEISASADYRLNLVHGSLTKGLVWTKSTIEDASPAARPFQIDPGEVLIPASSPTSVSTTAFGPDYLTSPQGSVLVFDVRGKVVARFSSGTELTSPRQGGANVVINGKSASFNFGEQGQKNLGLASVISRATLAQDTAGEDLPARLVPFEHHGSLYFPGAIPRQFDGQNFHEVGFSSFIDNFTVTAVTGTPSGYSAPLPIGSYVCAVVAEWTDASGELHQSAPIFKIVTLAATGGIVWTIKDTPKSDKPSINYVLYRTTVESGVQSVTLYRLLTKAGNPTGSVTEAESPISTHEPIYSTGDVVEGVAAPPCKHISEHGRRLVFAGTPDGNVWYSTKYVEGIAPRFNEDFTASPTGQGGGVVATASMDGRWYWLCERNVEYVTGDGPNEAFQGEFSDPQVVTFETGCISPQSVRVVPRGLMFRGNRGMYLIGRDGSSGYLGDDVSDLTGKVNATVHVPKTEETHVFQPGPEPELVYSTAYGQWSANTSREASSAVLWGDKLVWTDLDNDSTSIYFEDDLAVSDNGDAIESVVETAWLRLNTLSGFQRLKWVHLLATYRGASTIKLEIGYDESENYSETVRCFTGDLNLTPGQPIPLRWKPAIQKCRSVRFRITCDGGADSPTAGCDLTGLTLELGVKQGLFKKGPVETLGQAA
jgi:hypothetical protein